MFKTSLVPSKNHVTETTDKHQQLSNFINALSIFAVYNNYPPVQYNWGYNY